MAEYYARKAPRPYGGLEAAAAARKTRQQQVPRDSVSSRYTADPTKVLDTAGKDEGASNCVREIPT